MLPMNEFVHSVALVTCAELPEGDPDSRLAIGPLAERGIAFVPAVWNDPSVDWEAFDLAVVRSTWDYTPRRADFIAWARSVPRLANSAAVIEANTDKRYLAELSARGVPTVPTTWIHPADPWDAPRLAAQRADWVIKPAVSHSALDSGRYDLRHARQRTDAGIHVGRLQREGRLVMLQPYLHGIDREGETSLQFFAGEFSHAVRKAALLDGPDQGRDRRFEASSHELRTPTAAQRDLARRALEVAQGSEAALYARVDLVPGDDGHPLVIEVELTEPQLYLAYDPQAPARFADAIAAWLSRTTRGGVTTVRRSNGQTVRRSVTT